MAVIGSCSTQTLRLLISQQPIEPPKGILAYALEIIQIYKQSVDNQDLPLQAKYKPDWLKALKTCDTGYVNGPAALACELIHHSNSQLLKQIENHIIHSQNHLLTHLIVKQNNLTSDNLEDFQSQLGDNTFTLIDRITPLLKYEDKRTQALLELQLQELLQLCQKDPSILQRALESNNSSVPTLKEVASLCQFYFTIIEKQGQNFTIVQERLMKIFDLIKQLQSEDSGENTQFLNQFLLSKQPYTAEIDHPAPACTKQTPNTYQAVLTQEQHSLAKDMGTIANTGKQIMTIARNMHVQLPKELSNTIKAVAGTATVFASALTSNIPGMIMGFSSLVGLARGRKKKGSKKLGKMLRHLAQVQGQIITNQSKMMQGMQMLAKQQQHILNNQKILCNYLSHIDEKIDQILETQETLHQDLVTISRLIEKNAIETAKATQRVVEQILVNRAYINDERLSKIEKCVDIHMRLQASSQFNALLNCCATYDALEEFYETSARHGLKKNLNKLQSTLENPKRPSTLLWIHDDQQSHVVIEHFQELWNSIPILEREAAFKSFLLPLIKAQDLDKKLSDLSGSDSQNPLTSLNDKYVKYHTHLMEKPYDPKIVCEFAEAARGLHYFYELCENPGSDLRNLEELKSKKHLSKEGKFMLEGAIQQVNVAIAHLTLLSGDYLLPHLEKLAYQEHTRAKAVDLLSSSHLLAQNFITYLIVKNLSQSKVYDYQFAVSARGSHYAFKNLLKFPAGMNIVYENKWQVQLGQQKVDIPSPIHVLNGGIFEHHPQLQKLLNVRRLLACELAGYDLMSNLSAPQKQTYLWGLSLTNQ